MLTCRCILTYRNNRPWLLKKDSTAVCRTVVQEKIFCESPWNDLLFYREITAGRYPNGSIIGQEFEVSPAIAHGDVAYLKDRLLAPLAFGKTKMVVITKIKGVSLQLERSARILFFSSHPPKNWPRNLVFRDLLRETDWEKGFGTFFFRLQEVNSEDSLRTDWSGSNWTTNVGYS